MAVTPTLTTGTYWVDLPCPRCGALSTVAAVLTSTLTTPDDSEPSLRLHVRTKPVDHACGQSRLLETSELFGAESSPSP